jgi:hypothetical protein
MCRRLRNQLLGVGGALVLGWPGLVQAQSESIGAPGEWL